MISQTSKKRGNIAIDGASDESNGLCNLGLQRLPENCTIIKVDVDGKKDLHSVLPEDCELMAQYIHTAACSIPLPHQPQCNVIILTRNQVKYGYTLTIYLVLLQFDKETVFEDQHVSLLQSINPARCGGGGSIKMYYDHQTEKQTMALNISSYKNPVNIKDMIVTQTHFTITLCNTTDQDESSSRGDSCEISVNRKRARKGDNTLNYNKVSESNNKMTH